MRVRETLLFRSSEREKFLPIYLIFPFFIQFLFIMLMVNYTQITTLYIINVFVTIIYSFLYIFYFKTPIYLLYHLILIIISQNLLIGLGNVFSENQTSGQNLKLALVYKEVFAIIFVLFLFIKFKNNLRLFRFEKIFLGIVLIVLLSFFVSSATLDAKAYYIRVFLILFVSYAIGRLLFFGFRNKAIDLENVYSIVVKSGVIVAVIGFLFMMIGNDSPIWSEWFNFGIIQEAKRGVFESHPDFMTQLGALILPRMFSIFFDPISLGYFLATALLCTWLRKRNNPITQWILAAALLCTLVKGAIGVVLITYVWIIALKFLKLKPRNIIILFISVIIISFIILFNIDIKSSSDVHMAGLIEPILNSHNIPFGMGLGNGGNYYAIQSGISAWFVTHTGAESFFGVLLYQLGYPGVLLFLGFFIGAVVTMLKYSTKHSGELRGKYIIASGILFSLLIASLLQESTFGINFSGILLIIIGIYFSRIQNESENSV